MTSEPHRSSLCACLGRRSQKMYLYDQWGIRIAHCPNSEPHVWHGWTHYEDLRCPGVPERAFEGSV